MGIQGLLPFLKKIHTPVNISQFAGCTVAIDAYCWLHRGAFSCADKLALGEKTDMYVWYCMKYVNYLLQKNLKPIMVFDGCHLPSKADTEKSRRERRDLYRKKAAQLLREGKRGEARECLQRCIDISPEMALELMNACRARGVDCIVAPYEADAQLAYLNKAGIAQIVVTEDSDLLLFGCERVIFKMDHFGNGLMIEKKRLNEVLDIQTSCYTFEKFRYMCIMSGCDYHPSLPGIGLATACKVFKLARQADIKLLLKKLPTYISKKNLTVTNEYIEGFVKAYHTFLYQLVYDPLLRKMVPLNPYPDDIKPEDVKFAGHYLSKEKAWKIAVGNINIYTGHEFADFDPDTYVPPKKPKEESSMLHMLSIWDRNYRIAPKMGLLKEVQEAERPNLKGKEMTVKTKLPKSSPKKRPREAEECKESKSDNELTDLYNGTSPPKKRHKVNILLDLEDGDDIDFDDKMQFEAVPVCNISELDDVDPEIDEQPIIRTKASGSPKQFLESLKDAHTESNPDLVIDNKENNVKSPTRRNKFATGGLFKKSKFDLNAGKEVKSRYFATTEQLKESEGKIQSTETATTTCSTVSDIKMSNNISSTDSVCEKSNENSSSKHTGQTGSALQSNKKSRFSLGSKSNSKINSPGSLFNWGKFKSNSKSSLESGISPYLGSSDSANGQFKRIASDSNLKSARHSTGSLSDTVHRQSLSQPLSSVPPLPSLGNEGETEDEDFSQISVASCSQHSNLYSIDSDCMPDSHELDLSLTSDSQTVEDSVCVNENDTPESVSQKIKENTQVVSPTTSQNTSQISMSIPTPKPYGSSKAGCRVSGLSRKRSTKSAQSSSTAGKQNSIKDMFSMFAHKKTTPKFKHSDSNDDSDDVEIVGETPVIGTHPRDISSAVQRRLLT